MATREYDLDGDLTPPTIRCDLAPEIRDMERSFVELDVFRADDVTINFEITQNGDPFDLTNFTVKYQAKRAIGDTDLVFDKTGTKTDAKNGKVKIELVGSDLDTSLIEAETLQTQLFLTQPGSTQTIIQIPMVVNPSV